MTTHLVVREQMSVTCAALGAADGQRRAVAFALGVGRFANHHNADIAAVVALGARANVLQGHAVAGLAALERLPEGCATRGGCAAAALPRDRPAAHLVIQLSAWLPPTTIL